MQGYAESADVMLQMLLQLFKEVDEKVCRCYITNAVAAT